MAKRGRPKKVGPKIVKKRGRPPLPKPNGQEVLTQTEREMPADGDKALEALRTLADLNDQVRAAEVAEIKAKDAHDEAKTELKDAQKALSKKLWELTHKPNLPLFNAAQAEEDVSRIQEQADTGDTGVASEDSPASALEGGAEALVPPPLSVQAPEGSETAVDPSEPF